MSWLMVVAAGLVFCRGHWYTPTITAATLQKAAHLAQP